MLEALFKGKGCPTSKNFRDITITDEIAKVSGSAIRSSILPAVEQCALESQWGSGLHSGSTDVVHLAAKSIIHIASGMKLSAALLFIDIASAFASMARRLSINESTPDEQWISLLVSSGFSTDEIQDIIAETGKICSYTEAGCSEHLAAVLRDMHCFTWFAMEAVPGIGATTRGTQAGMPVADVVFAIAIRRIL